MVTRLWCTFQCRPLSHRHGCHVICARCSCKRFSMEIQYNAKYALWPGFFRTQTFIISVFTRDGTQNKNKLKKNNATNKTEGNTSMRWGSVILVRFPNWRVEFFRWTLPQQGFRQISIVPKVLFIVVFPIIIADSLTKDYSLLISNKALIIKILRQMFWTSILLR